MAANILTKRDGENEAQFLWRIGNAKNEGLVDITWDELARIMNSQFPSESGKSFGESRYRKMYQSAKRLSDLNCGSIEKSEAEIDQMQEAKRELQKERLKLHTEKLEYNRWLREDARDEMLAAKFADALRDAPQISFPDYQIRLGSMYPERSAVLIFGDAHYGTEFCVRGLNGELINEYSPEIFEKRMENLLAQVIDITNKEALNKLYVFSLGDSTDGILRVGQLMKLRYGVVEQTVLYANYIANWLNELSKFVHVDFQMVFGNHTELRLLNQKKGSFKDENTERFIREIIKVRLDGNPNFNMKTNPTGLIYEQVQGYNILGIHGEVKNMGIALKDFSITYGVPIDILIGGHKHHLKEETVGVDKEVITVPSIIGIDDYALSLNKTSRPGASLIIIEECSGVTLEYRIKL